MYKYGDTKHKAKHKARHKARHKAVNTKWNLFSNIIGTYNISTIQYFYCPPRKHIKDTIGVLNLRMMLPIDLFTSKYTISHIVSKPLV